MIKSRRMRWAGHVARMGEERGSYRVLVGKPKGKRTLGRPRRRWVDNIRMDLQEVGCGYMDWIGLAQDQDDTSWSCSQAVSKPVWHIPLLCVQWKTPNDGQRDCPKHLEFYSKSKFEKLLQLVGFIMRKQVMVQKKHHLESRNWNISLKYRGEDTLMFKGHVVKKGGGRISPLRSNCSSDLTVRSLTPRMILVDSKPWWTDRLSAQLRRSGTSYSVEDYWNVMAHAKKPNFVFRWKGRFHLNRRGCQFSRLLAAGVCASTVVMLDTPCSEVVWRVLATHFHSPVSPSLPLPCVTVCHHISTRVYNWPKTNIELSRTDTS